MKSKKNTNRRKSQRSDMAASSGLLEPSQNPAGHPLNPRALRVGNGLRSLRNAVDADQRLGAVHQGQIHLSGKSDSRDRLIGPDIAHSKARPSPAKRRAA